MPSKTHDFLVDEIRFGMSEFLRHHKKYIKDILSGECPGVWADASDFNQMHNCTGIGLVADAYIELEDGRGPMPVEVGRMKDGKWAKMIGEDDLPLRVFRCGFDGSVWILNPRHTDIENDCLAYYREMLPRAIQERGLL